MHIQHAAELIRSEYTQLPGLKLTFWQIQRLMRLSTEECSAALTTLLERRFLARTVEGAYVRGAVSADV